MSNIDNTFKELNDMASFKNFGIVTEPEELHRLLEAAISESSADDYEKGNILYLAEEFARQSKAKLT